MQQFALSLYGGYLANIVVGTLFGTNIPKQFMGRTGAYQFHMLLQKLFI